VEGSQVSPSIAGSVQGNLGSTSGVLDDTEDDWVIDLRPAAARLMERVDRSARSLGAARLGFSPDEDGPVGGAELAAPSSGTGLQDGASRQDAASLEEEGTDWLVGRGLLQPRRNR